MNLTLSDLPLTPVPNAAIPNFGFSVNIALISGLNFPWTYWGTWLFGEAKALAAYCDLLPINTLEKGLKLATESINLGSITAWGLFCFPSLLGFILLQGATDSLASSGLGLCVPAVQLEAKKPVSTGLFSFVDKSDIQHEPKYLNHVLNFLLNQE